MSDFDHETVFLLLGSNLGNKMENMHQAIGWIREMAGEIDETSSVWETASWGFSSQDRFYNVVVKIRTALEPLPLLEELHTIEKKLGRRRFFPASIVPGNSFAANGYNPNYVSRTIDIDILFFGNLIIHSEVLEIPHPRLHLRRFTMEPLMELIPGFVHPLLGKTIRQLYDDCLDKLEANPITKGL
jgi:2-amino-4-hydroxy-6-hydroxymethyldihydropteridine diphosphokinase